MSKEKNKPQFPDGKYIKRCFDFTEARVNDEGNVVEGHAAVYDQKVSIGDWFYEIIQKGAFDRTDLSDVALFLNHKWDDLPLARSRKSIPNSTMKVGPDDRGLFMSAGLDVENNTNARALVSAIKRQDVTGMSFAFIIGDEEWKDLDTKMPTRLIKSISKVIEVSAVTHPAYDTTDIGARSNSLESDRIALERARSVNINATSNEVEALRLKIKIKGEMK